MRMSLSKIVRIQVVQGLVALVGLASAVTAQAQSHAYINYERSSTESHFFVQQSVDGEYGKYKTTGTTTAADGTTKGYTTDQYWKGYGIGTGVGVEFNKFVQFVAGHTFVNMRYQDDALESLSGSRLNAGLRLVFLSPVANLELGGGMQGSRLDYQKQLENGSFYGSGEYFSLGFNYYLSTKVSVYAEAKMEKEHLVRSSGIASVQSIDTDSTVMGLGFRIWL